jgi:hypothetical protein
MGYMMRDEKKEWGSRSVVGAVGFAKRPKHDVTCFSATVRERLFIGMGDEWSMQAESGH